MIRHFLKVGFRNLWKNRLYSSINIFGLTVGLSACTLIALYVVHELSYDRFHEKADRIYRIHSDSKGFGLSTNSTPVLMDYMKDFPDVESATRVFRHWFDPMISRNKEKGFIEEQFFYVDTSFFSVFSVDVLRGEGASALRDPFNVLLTASTAKKYFGNEDPIGKTLKFNAEQDLRVAGIIRDIPSTSHFHPDFLASMATCGHVFWPNFLKSWGNLVKTYIAVAPHADVASLELRLTDIYQDKWGKDNRVTLRLMPLTDIHLHSTVAKDFGTNNDIRYVRLLGMIGIIILGISLINYMNLTAARGMTRAKEVGIRQAMGVRRNHLVLQFLAESVLFIVMATIVSVILTDSLLPAVGGMVQAPLSFADIPGPTLVAGLVMTIILLGCLGGLYPAFVISRFRAVQVLKGRIDSVRGGWLRKGLVISQFATGVVMLVATLVILAQMKFIRESRTGFTRDQVAVMPLKDPVLAEKLPALKNRWTGITGVQAVALANAMPGKGHAGDYIVHEGRSDELAVAVNWIDEGFVPALELEMAAGRNISPTFGADAEGAILLNVTAAAQLGYSDPEQAIGKVVKLSGTDGGRNRTIVGVVRDFNYESLHHPIEPLVLVPQFDRCAYLMVRMNASGLSGTLDNLRTVWLSLASEQPFSYFFMDENFQQLYLQDQRWSWVIGAGAGTAMLIACLGLLGLVMFTTQRRTKEIGIRKILGSSVSGIVGLLTKEYAVLVLVANIIAWPLAYLWMTDWLTQFAYRTHISWSVFPTVLLLSTGIAALTIAFQAIRAALANPTDALKYE